MFKKLFFLLAVCSGAFAYTLTYGELEDDPIRSLGLRSTRQADIFRAFHENSLFSQNIFIDVTNLDQSEKSQLQEAVQNAGYQKGDLGITTQEPRDLFHDLSLMITPSDLSQAISPEMIEKRAQDLLGLTSFPGGEQFLKAAQNDPFGLNEMLSKRVLPLIPPPLRGELQIFKSPDKISYEKVGQLYDTLVGMGQKVQFIGSDFFSLENYRSIKSDVTLCATLAIVLNILLFAYFTRRLSLAICLLIGSFVSYVFGFLALVLFQEKIYLIAVAFTSTFVSFNNEVLVHLSGLGKDDLRLSLGGDNSSNLAELRLKRIRGIWSAMGTTFLGFLVLLLGDTVIVRQMAISAIAGTLGFLLFIYCIRAFLSNVTFRPVNGKTVRIPRWLLGATLLVGAFLLFLRPKIQTKIEAFRFESNTLSRQIEHFNQKLSQSHLGQFVAVDLEQLASGQNLAAQLLEARKTFAHLGSHPLDLYQNVDEQNRAKEIFVSQYPEAARKLDLALRSRGLKIPIQNDFSSYEKIQTRSEVEFLDWVQKISPVKWYTKIDNGFVLFLPSLDSQDALDSKTVFSLSPASYYNKILTDLSTNLAQLFILSLCAMVLFLAYVQRSIWNVLYIVAPVVLCAGGFSLYSVATGQGLNIIHFMGFALTIALAMDYTSVTVSTEHNAEDRSKVLLTGSGSFVTFGVLLFAEHPVLRTLGATVTLGCVLGLFFALCLRVFPQAKLES